MLKKYTKNLHIWCISAKSDHIFVTTTMYIYNNYPEIIWYMEDLYEYT